MTPPGGGPRYRETTFPALEAVMYGDAFDAAVYPPRWILSLSLQKLGVGKVA